MNSKIMALLAIVVVAVVVGAAAVVVVQNDDDDSKTTSKATGRLAVYGNANNDDYLDEDDVDTIQEILDTIEDGGSWDYKLYPYADANVDGSITSADLEYVEKFLSKDDMLESGEKIDMYYTNCRGNTCSVSYPIDPTATIGTAWYYGAYDAMVLGCYDRITAGTTLIKSYSEDMFPGCTNLIEIGTQYTFDPELVMKSGVKVLLAVSNQTMYDEMKKIGVDAIMLYGSGISRSGMDVVSSIITMGVLLSCEDNAAEYAKYYDDLRETIDEKQKEIKREYTYVMPYNPTSTVENMVDTEERSTGYMLGDVYALSLVPLTDLVYSADDCCPTIATEDIMEWDPDFIVVSFVANVNATDDPAEIQKRFEDAWALFSETNAYKNGNMIGICYSSIGTTIGLSVAPLLCSYLWPDVFDEDDAWEYLEDAVDKFTMLDTEKHDIKDCGGLIVYKMSS